MKVWKKKILSLLEKITNIEKENSDERNENLEKENEKILLLLEKITNI